MKTTLKLFLISLLIILLTACGNATNTIDTQEREDVPMPTSTYTQVPTNTPAPTETPLPTETPTPTFTPTPVPIVYDQEYLDQFTLKTTITWNGTVLKALAWSSDNQKIAIGGEAGKIWINDLDSGTVTEIEYEGRATVYRLSFNPEGNLLAAGNTYGDVHIYDSETGDLIYSLETKTFSEIEGMVFDEDSNQMLISLHYKKHYKHAELLLWNYQTGEITQRWNNPSNGFTHSSPILVSWSNELDSYVVIWSNFTMDNANTGGAREEIKFTQIDLETGEFLENRVVEFSTFESEIIVTPDNEFWQIDHKSNDTSEIKNAISGESIAILQTGGIYGDIYGEARSDLSLDGKILRVTSNEVTYWNTENWAQVEPQPDAIFPENRYGPRIGWSPDLSMYYDEEYRATEVRIWEAP